MRTQCITAALMAVAWVPADAADVVTHSERLPNVRDCPACPQMIAPPPGEFTMGASGEADAEDRWANRERPAHRRTAKRRYFLSAGPVTRGQFAAFVEATGYQAGGGCLGFDVEAGRFSAMAERDWSNPGFAQTDDHPVVCVTWFDAIAYADWLTAGTGADYRLPSEAEWEYAARAGRSAIAPPWAHTEAVCEHANGPDASLASTLPRTASGARLPVLACDDGYAATSPVGTFPANAWGFYDVIGNVREWTADCFVETYAGIADGRGLAAVSTAPCEQRVLRSSPYGYTPAHQRYTIRYRYPEHYRYPDVGFRVARDLNNDGE